MLEREGGATRGWGQRVGPGGWSQILQSYIVVMQDPTPILSHARHRATTCGWALTQR